MIYTNKYVKLDDVLKFIPNNDICGPKPSALREKLNALPTVELEPNMYLIYEDTLKQILAGYYKLCALEQDGVDNWEWYSEACNNWLNKMRPANLDKDEAWNYGFEEFVADIIPSKFKEIKDV